MPLEDGIVFLKELRARGDRIPFVLFTGRGREDIVIEAINSGADAYVQKGTETRSVFTELVHRIRHAVDRIRAENALMESETRYRSLIDGSSVGILLTDANLEYVYSNRRWLEMTSRTEEESKGRGWMAWIAPEDRKAFEEGWKLSAESGGERSFEYRYAGKDGDTVWIWGNASPLRDAEGSVTSYISTNVDITERRRIEEALLEKERTIARASNLTKMGYWIWKAETGVITPSDGLSSLLGIPVGTTLPHDTFFDMVHPEDRKAVIAAFGDALNGKPDIKTEHRMVRSDGSVITVRDTVEITTVKGNRPVYIMGMVQDITELTRVSETLRETENLYHMVFDTIAEGVVVVDRESTIIVSNGEAARLLGYSLGGKAPTMNQVDEHLVREDGTDCPLDESPSRITVSTGRPLNDEIRGLRQPSGEVRWLSVNTRPLFSEGDASPSSVVVSLVDISEKKMAKDGLAEANRKLALLSNITRHDIREVVRRGLAQTYGNYRATVALLGMPGTDYTRFLNFLNAHDCRVDYRPYRKGCEPPRVAQPALGVGARKVSMVG
jgi:PAS domain S-box-containing protein